MMQKLTASDETFQPREGLAVLHLFCVGAMDLDRSRVVAAVKAATTDGYQVVAFGVLGHKAQVGFMAIGPSLVRLKELQRDLERSGLSVVDSYVSLTEVSEYAQGMPAERKAPRLYPVLPPEGLSNICFYGMSKKREPGANWYLLPYE